MDSNQDKQIQSLLYYRYTIPQRKSRFNRDNVAEAFPELIGITLRIDRPILAKNQVERQIQKLLFSQGDEDGAEGYLEREFFLEENSSQDYGKDQAQFVNRSDLGSIPELQGPEIKKPGDTGGNAG